MTITTALQSYINYTEVQNMLVSAKDMLQKEIDNAAYGRSGKIVWFGTKAAVKAAK